MKRRLFSSAICGALVMAGCSGVPTTGTSAPVSAAEQTMLASSARTQHYDVMATNTTTDTTATGTASTAPTTTTGSLVTGAMQSHSNMTMLSGVTVTGSSQRSGDWFKSDNLMDGNLHSAWGPEASDTAPTLTFDLKAATTIRGMGIKQSGGATFDVAVSTGGGDWKVIATNQTSTAAMLDWVDLDATSADRVQLRFHGDHVNTMLVCEVQWFGGDGNGASPSPMPSTTTSASPSTMPSTMPSTTPSTTTSASPSTMPSTTTSASPSTMPSTTTSATPSVMPTPTPTPVATPTMPPTTQPSTDCGCKVTGGGWLALDGRGKGKNKLTFGFVAMEQNGQAKGEIEVNDHLTKAKFHGTVDAVTCNDVNATFSGKLDNGVRFTVTVADNGEPGNHDTFSFQTAAGFSLNGLLGAGVHGGGNIQIHHEDCESSADKVRTACDALAGLHIGCIADAQANFHLDLTDFDSRCDRGDFDN